MIYAGGSSSSEANTIALVGCDVMSSLGSSLSSIDCAAIVEAAVCLDLLAMYSVSADLGKKICEGHIRAVSDEG